MNKKKAKTRVCVKDAPTAEQTAGHCKRTAKYGRFKLIGLI